MDFRSKNGIHSPFAGHHNIAWELCGDRRFRPDLGTIDDFFSEIDKSDRNVILSSEDFESATDIEGLRAASANSSTWTICPPRPVCRRRGRCLMFGTCVRS
jgi:hypothetical protein